MAGGGYVDSASLDSVKPVRLSSEIVGLGSPTSPIRTDPTGTTVQPVSIVSGGGTGGGGAATVADGADVCEGATTDAAVTSDVSGTLSAKLRGLVKILSNVWDSANGRLKVDGSGVTQPVSGTFWQSTQPVSGTFFPGTQPVSGTFWQSTQPVSGAVTATLPAETTKVIGTVNVAAGQTIASTVADGSDVTLGSKADAKSSATDATAVTAMQVLKQISASVQAPPSQAVTNAGTFATQDAIADGANVTLGAKADAKSTATDATAVTAMSVLKQISASVQAPPSQAVTNAGTFAVQAAAVLGAETTKVIGTVNVAAAQTIAVTQATAANLNATVAQATLTKGTQGATGVTVQELKDAGRNSTSFFTILPIVTTTSEALLSLTGFKAGAAVGTTTTPAVVTSGKKYRITSINCSYIAIATAGSTRLSIRKKVGGTVAVTDPVIWQAIVGGPAAVAGVSQTVSFDVDMEIDAGDGIGVSQLGLSTTQAAAAVGYGAITIYGYEY